MSAPVFAFVVAVVLVAFVGGYVWGHLNGSASAQHPDGPETCRAKLRAAETTAQMWRRRALLLEGENTELVNAKAELERAETVTVELLLSELEAATKAAPAGQAV